MSEAIRQMIAWIAPKKRSPFEPLVPNEETIRAMEAARRGELIDVGSVEELMADFDQND